MSQADILDRLFDVIQTRAQERPSGSYVVSLLDGGIPAIAAKIREESAEVIAAAESGDRTHLSREVADLVFHTWVLMAEQGVSPQQVYDVLADRFGVGGFEEKASRRGDPDAR
jgi:phosphoribosyl-ATP pyrophosphohydrolase